MVYTVGRSNPGIKGVMDVKIITHSDVSFIIYKNGNRESSDIEASSNAS